MSQIKTRETGAIDLESWLRISVHTASFMIIRRKYAFASAAKACQIIASPAWTKIEDLSDQPLTGCSVRKSCSINTTSSGSKPLVFAISSTSFLSRSTILLGLNSGSFSKICFKQRHGHLPRGPVPFFHSSHPRQCSSKH